MRSGRPVDELSGEVVFYGPQVELSLPRYKLSLLVVVGRLAEDDGVERGGEVVSVENLSPAFTAQAFSSG